MIIQGHRILESWRYLFKQTKMQIEDNLDRWDFQEKLILDRIEYMSHTLDELRSVTEILKKFLVFLGPNLKAVTGNS